VEGAEVGQWRGLFGEQRHPPVVRAPLHWARALDAVLDLVGELDQDLDEVGDGAVGMSVVPMLVMNRTVFRVVLLI